MNALNVLILFVLARALRIRVRLARHERIAWVRYGWISCELWRKASLVAHLDAAGVRTFPLPRETRTRVWCCAGLPIRCEVRSLGLPAQVSDHIDAVGAAQFDALFPAEFRRAERGEAGPASVSTVRRAHLREL